ncbi:peptidase M42, partial [Streptococcus pneumoniae]|nr:peptidase M42 [Streptococcus pneumoniae]
MAFNWKEQETISTLEKLVNIPSPSGYTMQVMDFVTDFFDQATIPYIISNKGGVIATIKGQDDKRHRLLTAHVDTLGAMVKEIKPSGRLKLSLVGGFKFNAIEGEN